MAVKLVFLHQMFDSADLNMDGELTFREFAVCYNNIMDYRAKHNLAPIDMHHKVTAYLDHHKDLQSPRGASHASTLDTSEQLVCWPGAGVRASGLQKLSSTDAKGGHKDQLCIDRAGRQYRGLLS
jgi:hypothetical protein